MLPSIVWFRQDFRLTDNPALFYAVQSKKPLILVYIAEKDSENEGGLGGASKWWLHNALNSLKIDLNDLGANLTLRASASSLEELKKLIAETSAKAIYWNDCYEPSYLQQDREIKKIFESQGILCHNFNGSLLHHPETIATKQGNPYQVFTPFWKACTNKNVSLTCLPKIESIISYKKDLFSLEVDDLQLRSKADWEDKFEKYWNVGEPFAIQQLQNFIESKMGEYALQRDFPSIDGTSLLSPYLHFGHISPRQILHAVTTSKQKEYGEPFIRQIYWREFAYHLIYHFPHTVNTCLNANFEKFPNRNEEKEIQQWQAGQTGYPIVDAAMKQLWETGWMHNRVRMIVASFLVKDLLVYWKVGAKWFWDTLLDADLANNTLGWQWIAGCGADAAPYFRIFNPILQGQKFDPTGAYVRKWIPELSNLPDKWIHTPWLAPKDILRAAGIELGYNYPKPIVDHAMAKERALNALYTIKNKKNTST